MSELNDFEIIDGELIAYSGDNREVYIPETVKTITGICSRGKKNNIITNINIPESVTSISSMAFAGCENLININVDEDNENYSSYYGVLYDKLEKLLLSVPAGREGKFSIRNSAVTINPRAFYKCKKIKEVEIPEGMFTIGPGIFDSCTSIKKIFIPSSVKDISDSSFINCTNLTDIEADEKNINYVSSNGCLYKKTIREIEGLSEEISKYINNYLVKELFIVPEGEFVTDENIIKIGNNSFRNCKKLNSVVITYGLITIGKNAFDNCTNLKTVSISEGVKEILSNSFSNCKNLKWVTIPESITYIDKDAFNSCPEINLICKEGSYGERFARENNISFKSF